MSSRTARFFMDPSLIPPRPTNPKEAAAWDAQYGGQLDDTPLFQTPPGGLTVAALPTPTATPQIGSSGAISGGTMGIDMPLFGLPDTTQPPVAQPGRVLSVTDELPPLSLGLPTIGSTSTVTGGTATTPVQPLSPLAPPYAGRPTISPVPPPPSPVPQPSSPLAQPNSGTNRPWHEQVFGPAGQVINDTVAHFQNDPRPWNQAIIEDTAGAVANTAGAIGNFFATMPGPTYARQITADAFAEPPVTFIPPKAPPGLEYVQRDGKWYIHSTRPELATGLMEWTEVPEGYLTNSGGMNSINTTVQRRNAMFTSLGAWLQGTFDDLIVTPLPDIQLPNQEPLQFTIGGTGLFPGTTVEIPAQANLSGFSLLELIKGPLEPGQQALGIGNVWGPKPPTESHPFLDPHTAETKDKPNALTGATPPAGTIPSLATPAAYTFVPPGQNNGLEYRYIDGRWYIANTRLEQTTGLADMTEVTNAYMEALGGPCFVAPPVSTAPVAGPPAAKTVLPQGPVTLPNDPNAAKRDIFGAHNISQALLYGVNNQGQVISHMQEINAARDLASYPQLTDPKLIDQFNMLPRAAYGWRDDAGNALPLAQSYREGAQWLIDKQNNINALEAQAAELYLLSQSATDISSNGRVASLLYQVGQRDLIPMLTSSNGSYVLQIAAARVKNQAEDLRNQSFASYQDLHIPIGEQIGWNVALDVGAAWDIMMEAGGHTLLGRTMRYVNDRLDIGVTEAMGAIDRARFAAHEAANTPSFGQRLGAAADTLREGLHDAREGARDLRDFFFDGRMFAVDQPSQRLIQRARELAASRDPNSILYNVGNQLSLDNLIAQSEEGERAARLRIQAANDLFNPSQFIDEKNLPDDKPLRYFENRSSLILPPVTYAETGAKPLQGDTLREAHLETYWGKDIPPDQKLNLPANFGNRPSFVGKDAPTLEMLSGFLANRFAFNLTNRDGKLSEVLTLAAEADNIPEWLAAAYRGEVNALTDIAENQKTATLIRLPTGHIDPTTRQFVSDDALKTAMAMAALSEQTGLNVDLFHVRYADDDTHDLLVPVIVNNPDLLMRNASYINNPVAVAKAKIIEQRAFLSHKIYDTKIPADKARYTEYDFAFDPQTGAYSWRQQDASGNWVALKDGKIAQIAGPQTTAEQLAGAESLADWTQPSNSFWDSIDDLDDPNPIPRVGSNDRVKVQLAPGENKTAWEIATLDKLYQLMSGNTEGAASYFRFSKQVGIANEKYWDDANKLANSVGLEFMPIDIKALGPSEGTRIVYRNGGAFRLQPMQGATYGGLRQGETVLDLNERTNTNLFATLLGNGEGFFNTAPGRAAYADIRNALMGDKAGPVMLNADTIGKAVTHPYFEGQAAAKAANQMELAQNANEFQAAKFLFEAFGSSKAGGGPIRSVSTAGYSVDDLIKADQLLQESDLPYYVDFDSAATWGGGAGLRVTIGYGRPQNQLPTEWRAAGLKLRQDLAEVNSLGIGAQPTMLQAAQRKFDPILYSAYQSMTLGLQAEPEMLFEYANTQGIRLNVIPEKVFTYENGQFLTGAPGFINGERLNRVSGDQVNLPAFPEPNPQYAATVQDSYLALNQMYEAAQAAGLTVVPKGLTPNGGLIFTLRTRVEGDPDSIFGALEGTKFGATLTAAMNYADEMTAQIGAPLTAGAARLKQATDAAMIGRILDNSLFATSGIRTNQAKNVILNTVERYLTQSKAALNGPIMDLTNLITVVDNVLTDIGEQAPKFPRTFNVPTEGLGIYNQSIITEDLANYKAALTAANAPREQAAAKLTNASSLIAPSGGLAKAVEKAQANLDSIAPTYKSMLAELNTIDRQIDIAQAIINNSNDPQAVARYSALITDLQKQRNDFLLGTRTSPASDVKFMRTPFSEIQAQHEAAQTALTKAQADYNQAKTSYEAIRAVANAEPAPFAHPAAEYLTDTVIQDYNQGEMTDYVFVRLRPGMYEIDESGNLVIQNQNVNAMNKNRRTGARWPSRVDKHGWLVYQTPQEAMGTADWSPVRRPGMMSYRSEQFQPELTDQIDDFQFFRDEGDTHDYTQDATYVDEPDRGPGYAGSNPYDDGDKELFSIYTGEGDEGRMTSVERTINYDIVAVPRKWLMSAARNEGFSFNTFSDSLTLISPGNVTGPNNKLAPLVIPADQYRIGLNPAVDTHFGAQSATSIKSDAYAANIAGKEASTAAVIAVTDASRGLGEQPKTQTFWGYWKGEETPAASAVVTPEGTIPPGPPPAPKMRFHATFDMGQATRLSKQQWEEIKATGNSMLVVSQNVSPRTEEEWAALASTATEVVTREIAPGVTEYSYKLPGSDVAYTTRGKTPAVSVKDFERLMPWAAPEDDRLKFGYDLMPGQKFIKDANIKETDLKQWYQDHPERVEQLRYFHDLRARVARHTLAGEEIPAPLLAEVRQSGILSEMRQVGLPADPYQLENLIIPDGSHWIQGAHNVAITTERYLQYNEFQLLKLEAGSYLNNGQSLPAPLVERIKQAGVLEELALAGIQDPKPEDILQLRLPTGMEWVDQDVYVAQWLPEYRKAAEEIDAEEAALHEAIMIEQQSYGAPEINTRLPPLLEGNVTTQNREVVDRMLANTSASLNQQLEDTTRNLQNYIAGVESRMQQRTARGVVDTSADIFDQARARMEAFTRQIREQAARANINPDGITDAAHKMNMMAPVGIIGGTGTLAADDGNEDTPQPLWQTAMGVGLLMLGGIAIAGVKDRRLIEFPSERGFINLPFSDTGMSARTALGQVIKTADDAWIYEVVKVDTREGKDIYRVIYGTPNAQFVEDYVTDLPADLKAGATLKPGASIGSQAINYKAGEMPSPTWYETTKFGEEAATIKQAEEATRQAQANAQRLQVRLTPNGPLQEATVVETHEAGQTYAYTVDINGRRYGVRRDQIVDEHYEPDSPYEDGDADIDPPWAAEEDAERAARLAAPATDATDVDFYNTPAALNEPSPAGAARSTQFGAEPPAPATAADDANMALASADESPDADLGPEIPAAPPQQTQRAAPTQQTPPAAASAASAGEPAERPLTATERLRMKFGSEPPSTGRPPISSSPDPLYNAPAPLPAKVGQTITLPDPRTGKPVKAKIVDQLPERDPNRLPYQVEFPSGRRMWVTEGEVNGERVPVGPRQQGTRGAVPTEPRTTQPTTPAAPAAPAQPATTQATTASTASAPATTQATTAGAPATAAAAPPAGAAPSTAGAPPPTTASTASAPATAASAPPAGAAPSTAGAPPPTTARTAPPAIGAPAAQSAGGAGGTTPPPGGGNPPPPIPNMNRPGQVAPAQPATPNRRTRFGYEPVPPPKITPPQVETPPIGAAPFPALPPRTDNVGLQLIVKDPKDNTVTFGTVISQAKPGSARWNAGKHYEVLLPNGKIVYVNDRDAKWARGGYDPTTVPSYIKPSSTSPSDRPVPLAGGGGANRPPDDPNVAFASADWFANDNGQYNDYLNSQGRSGWRDFDVSSNARYSARPDTSAQQAEGQVAYEYNPNLAVRGRRAMFPDPNNPWVYAHIGDTPEGVSLRASTGNPYTGIGFTPVPHEGTSPWVWGHVGATPGGMPTENPLFEEVHGPGRPRSGLAWMNQNLNPAVETLQTKANRVVDQWDLIGAAITSMTSDPHDWKIIVEAIAQDPKVLIRGISKEYLPGLANQADQFGMIHIGGGALGNEFIAGTYPVIDWSSNYFRDMARFMDHMNWNTDRWQQIAEAAGNPDLLQPAWTAADFRLYFRETVRAGAEAYYGVDEGFALFDFARDVIGTTRKVQAETTLNTMPGGWIVNWLNGTGGAVGEHVFDAGPMAEKEAAALRRYGGVMPTERTQAGRIVLTSEGQVVEIAEGRAGGARHFMGLDNKSFVYSAVNALGRQFGIEINADMLAYIDKSLIFTEKEVDARTLVGQIWQHITNTYATGDEAASAAAVALIQGTGNALEAGGNAWTGSTAFFDGRVSFGEASMYNRTFLNTTEISLGTLAPTWFDATFKQMLADENLASATDRAIVEQLQRNIPIWSESMSRQELAGAIQNTILAGGGNPQSFAKYVGSDILPRYDDMHNAALQVASRTAERIMLDPSHQTNFDAWASNVAAFSYFAIHGTINAIERAPQFMRPLLFWSRWENAARKENEQENVPNRYNGTLPGPFGIRIPNIWDIILGVRRWVPDQALTMNLTDDQPETIEDILAAANLRPSPLLTLATGALTAEPVTGKLLRQMLPIGSLGWNIAGALNQLPAPGEEGGLLGQILRQAYDSENMQFAIGREVGVMATNQELAPGTPWLNAAVGLLANQHAYETQWGLALSAIPQVALQTYDTAENRVYAERAINDLGRLVFGIGFREPIDPGEIQAQNTADDFNAVGYLGNLAGNAYAGSNNTNFLLGLLPSQAVWASRNSLYPTPSNPQQVIWQLPGETSNTLLPQPMPADRLDSVVPTVDIPSSDTPPTWFKPPQFDMNYGERIMDPKDSFLAEPNDNTALYVLVDPVTGDMRYVGQTVHPSQRYTEHVEEFNEKGFAHPKTRWEAQLYQQGMYPKMYVFDWMGGGTTEPGVVDQVDEMEQIWIGYFYYVLGNNVNVQVPERTYWEQLMAKNGLNPTALETKMKQWKLEPVRFKTRPQITRNPFPAFPPATTGDWGQKGFIPNQQQWDWFVNRAKALNAPNGPTGPDYDLWLPGIGAQAASVLKQKYPTWEALAQANPNDLLKIPGISTRQAWDYPQLALQTVLINRNAIPVMTQQNNFLYMPVIATGSRQQANPTIVSPTTTPPARIAATSFSTHSGKDEPAPSQPRPTKSFGPINPPDPNIIQNAAIKNAPYQMAGGSGRPILGPNPDSPINTQNYPQVITPAWTEKQTIISEANRLGINPIVAAAVMQVESGGQGFTTAKDANGNEYQRMKIRFEVAQAGREFNEQFGPGQAQKGAFSEYFKWTQGDYQNQFFRTDPNGEWINVHQSQDTEYQALQLARQVLGDEAALQATAMGKAQVMGFNYADLNYGSAGEMFAALGDPTLGNQRQTIGFFQFLESNGLTGSLRDATAESLHEFITRYNGSAEGTDLHEAYYGRMVAAIQNTYTNDPTWGQPTVETPVSQAGGIIHGLLSFLTQVQQGGYPATHPDHSLPQIAGDLGTLAQAWFNGTLFSDPNVQATIANYWPNVMAGTKQTGIDKIRDHGAPPPTTDDGLSDEYVYFENYYVTVRPGEEFWIPDEIDGKKVFIPADHIIVRDEDGYPNPDFVNNPQFNPDHPGDSLARIAEVYGPAKAVPDTLLTSVPGYVGSGGHTTYETPQVVIDPNRANEFNPWENTPYPGSGTPGSGPGGGRGSGAPYVGFGPETPVLPGLPSPHGPMRMHLPFEGTHEMTQAYGENKQAYAQFGLEGHAGMDFALPEGTPLRAPIAGVVSQIGYDENGYGHFIDITNAAGMTVRVAHLGTDAEHSGIPPTFVAGETLLPQDAFIGFSGNTGNSTGPHVDISVRIDGVEGPEGMQGWLDPAQYLPVDTGGATGWTWKDVGFLNEDEIQAIMEAGFESPEMLWASIVLLGGDYVAALLDDNINAQAMFTGQAAPQAQLTNLNRLIDSTQGHNIVNAVGALMASGPKPKAKEDTPIPTIRAANRDASASREGGKIVVDRGKPAQAGTPLRPGLIEGLTQSAIDDLAEVGIKTLEQLRALNPEAPMPAYGNKTQAQWAADVVKGWDAKEASTVINRAKRWSPPNPDKLVSTYTESLGIDPKYVGALYNAGIVTLDDLAHADMTTLEIVLGMPRKQAQVAINNANNLLGIPPEKRRISGKQDDPRPNYYAESAHLISIERTKWLWTQTLPDGRSLADPDVFINANPEDIAALTGYSWSIVDIVKAQNFMRRGKGLPEITAQNTLWGVQGNANLGAVGMSAEQQQKATDSNVTQYYQIVMMTPEELVNMFNIQPAEGKSAIEIALEWQQRANELIAKQMQDAQDPNAVVTTQPATPKEVGPEGRKGAKRGRAQSGAGPTSPAAPADPGGTPPAAPDAAAAAAAPADATLPTAPAANTPGPHHELPTPTPVDPATPPLTDPSLNLKGGVKSVGDSVGRKIQQTQPGQPPAAQPNQSGYQPLPGDRLTDNPDPTLVAFVSAATLRRLDEELRTV